MYLQYSGNSIATFGRSHKDLSLVFWSEGVANSVNPSKYKGQISTDFSIVFVRHVKCKSFLCGSADTGRSLQNQVPF